MQFNDAEHELMANTETDLLLVDMPIDLLKEQIRYQIQNPLTNNVNFVENINDLIRELRDNHGDNEEVVLMADNLTVDVFQFVINELDTKFQISLDTDQFGPGDYSSIGNSLYKFLILRYKKNITRFLHRFILKNKKMLAEQFENSVAGKKKDVTTIAIKKQVKNKEDAIILSRLPEVIRYVMDLEIEPLEFLKHASDDKVYEAGVLKDLIQRSTMIGSFVQPYLKTIMVDYDGVVDEIQTEVKMKLMKKMA